MSGCDVFDFQLQEFAYARSRRGEKADDEIPVAFRWVVQLPLEVGVVRVAYDILQKRLLLDAYEQYPFINSAMIVNGFRIRTPSRPEPDPT